MKGVTKQCNGRRWQDKIMTNPQPRHTYTLHIMSQTETSLGILTLISLSAVFDNGAVALFSHTAVYVLFSQQFVILWDM